ncbi:MAG: nuclear transport factor 2 family protein [Pseudomonadota bacterium]
MENQDANDAQALVRRFFAAFSDNEDAAMADCLAQDVEAHITAADGGTMRLCGRDAFMANILAMDTKAVAPTVQITQILSVDARNVLVMIEVKAERKGRSLHNFAAFLMAVEVGRIVRIHMVEALPQESATFWKA